MYKILAMLALGSGMLVAPAYGDSAICPSTGSCVLHFTAANSGLAAAIGSATGEFGTLTLSLESSGIRVVAYSEYLNFIRVGAPAAKNRVTFGFNDSLGGGLTVSDFRTGVTASAASYYGYVTSGTTASIHFNEFGYFYDGANTNRVSAGDTTKSHYVSFLVTKSGTVITDVNDILVSNGLAYFAADVCLVTSSGCVTTGTIAVTGASSSAVPEPDLAFGSDVLLPAFALGAAGLVLRRRKITG